MVIFAVAIVRSITTYCTLPTSAVSNLPLLFFVKRTAAVQAD